MKYTVKTLIEELQKYPSQTPVCILTGDQEDAGMVESVDLHKNVTRNNSDVKMDIVVLWSSHEAD